MKKRLLLLLCFLASTPSPANAQLQSLVSSNTDFALRLYSQLARDSGNLFFSPYSISTCLAMLYTGARGNTEQQMAQVFGFMTNQAQLASGFGELQRQLEATRQKNLVELDLANALWTQEGYPFLSDFLATATNQYEASISQVDFINSADAVTKAINDWVAQATHDRIQNMLQPGILDPNTKLVLGNAIYFRGAWTVAFDPTNTSTQPFYLPGNKFAGVPLMYQPRVSGSTALAFNYMQSYPLGEAPRSDDFQAIELPYGTNQLSMMILLPSQVDGLPSLEQQLSPAFFSNVVAQFQAKPIDVFLPRFTLGSKLDLKMTLIDMGMSDAFDPYVADFSGVGGPPGSYIHFVLHDAWTQVNEQGTESAAATLVGWGNSSGGGPVFRADHPFIFLIRDTQSGSLLFLGRFVDPGQAEAAPPQLQVSIVSTSTLALSWPASSKPFTLQESTDLTGPNWTRITNSPTMVAQRNQLVLSRSPGNKFYRLVQNGN